MAETKDDLLAIPAFLDRNKTDAMKDAAQADVNNGGIITNRPAKGGHATLAPSAADRWMKCAGSVRLSAGMPNRSSIYAEEGTDAHQLAAACLDDGTDAWEHVGEEYARGGKDETKFTVTRDMADAVQVYLDEVRRIIALDPKAEHRTEVQFDLDDVVPGNWGTSDKCIYLPTLRRLVIMDYKHGAGIAVEAEENAQLMNYGAGAVHVMSPIWHEIDEVELVIVQPRCFHPDGAIRRWTIKLDALGEWVSQELAPKAKAALAPDAPVGPSGDHCRFCPARIVCPLLAADLEEITAMKPEDVKSLDSWELAELRTRAAPLKFLIGAIEDEIFRRLMAGEKVPGVKVVAKKSDRVWKEGAEPALKAVLGERLYDKPKMLTPPAVEKIRDGKELVKLWAFRPDTGQTLADEDDRRPAVPIRTAAEVFSGVDGGKAA